MKKQKIKRRYICRYERELPELPELLLLTGAADQRAGSGNYEKMPSETDGKKLLDKHPLFVIESCRSVPNGKL